MGGNESRCQAPRSTVKPLHNYEAIMRDADTPVHDLSEEKKYDLICSGVFLNQRRKKYWVEKNSGHNCFMLYSRDLIIIWGENKHYWKYSYIQETSKVLVEVAELLSVWWLSVRGRIDASNLSPGITYEVLLVAMLKDDASGWEGSVDIYLQFPNGEKQERKELLQEKPRGEWLEILIGDFKTSENMGEMQFSMFENGRWKRGLVIKGVVIRPKN